MPIGFPFGNAGSTAGNRVQVFKDGVWQSAYTHQELTSNYATNTITNNKIRMTATGQNNGNLSGKSTLNIGGLPVGKVIFLKFSNITIPTQAYGNNLIGSLLKFSITNRPLNNTSTIVSDIVEPNGVATVYLEAYTSVTNIFEIEEIWLEEIES